MAFSSSNDDPVLYTAVSFQDVKDPVHQQVLRDHEIARRIADWMKNNDIDDLPEMKDDYNDEVEFFGKKKRTPNFKPSSIGSSCLRRIGYEYQNEETPTRDIDAKSQINFAIGKAVHKKIIQPVALEIWKENCIIEAPVFINAQTYLGPGIEDPAEMLTRGQLDILLHIHDPRAFLKVGVEIKSINKEQCEKVSSSGPQDYVHMQGVCYHLGLGLDYVMFLYVQKNNSFMLPTYHPLNRDVLSKVCVRVGSIRSVVRNGQLPDPSPSKIACGICNYKHVCPKAYGRRSGRPMSTTMNLGSPAGGNNG